MEKSYFSEHVWLCFWQANKSQKDFNVFFMEKSRYAAVGMVREILYNFLNSLSSLINEQTFKEEPKKHSCWFIKNRNVILLDKTQIAANYSMIAFVFGF